MAPAEPMLRYLMPAHTGLNPQDVSREGLKLGAQPIVLYGRGGAGTGNGCRAVGCGGKNRPGKGEWEEAMALEKARRARGAV